MYVLKQYTLGMNGKAKALVLDFSLAD